MFWRRGLPAAHHSSRVLMFEGKSCSHFRAFTISVCVRAAEGRRLPEAARAAGTLWHHQVLHRRLGGLRAASRCRDASRRQGEHTENREQAHQSPDPDQAVGASHAMLFQDGTHARFGDWALHQSVCIWTGHLRGANTCETPSSTFPSVRQYCRATPAESLPFLTKPDSSNIKTPSGSPSSSATSW